jgi:alginate O-acetyltransferase complex protein AlgI
VRLHENFDRPYLATSPREFWRRWHISLSTWLRDYLYVSLGGNRRGAVRTQVNLLLTMVLGGLWHGAAWTFVAWGAYHGVLLVGHRLLAARWRWPVGRLGTLGARLLTFHLVCLGWILFRSRTLAEAWQVVAGLGTWEFIPSRAASLAALLVALVVVVEAGPPAVRLRERFVRLSPWWQGLGYATAVVLVFLFSPATARFIYFQF